MGNYTTGSLLVLVLVLVATSSLFQAATSQYCGPYEATDSNFSGYAGFALDKVVYNLVTDNAGRASVTWPHDAVVSATATAWCPMTDTECTECLDELLPYVLACTSFTTGGAYTENMCSLGFQSNGL
ncbi:hypothetical protein LINGRAHAP2_LOCUS36574 [Linum grandiflorum]